MLITARYIGLIFYLSYRISSRKLGFPGIRHGDFCSIERLKRR